MKFSPFVPFSKEIRSRQIILVSLWMASSALAQTSPLDDPMLSLSQHDNINKLIAGGLKWDHTELLINRCSVGERGVDTSYEINKEIAEKFGIYWGAYASTHGNEGGTAGEQSSIKQAKHFVQEVLGKRGNTGKAKKVLLCIDWLPARANQTKKGYAEESMQREMTSEQLAEEYYVNVKDMADFCSEVTKLTGKPPLIHTHVRFLRSYISKNQDEAAKVIIGKSPLWITAYESKVPEMSEGSPWNKWTFWMYTSYDVYKQMGKSKDVITPDLSYFNGRRGKELLDWYNNNSWDYQLMASNE